jgi:lipoyl(octanoyl) transferase
MKLQIVDIGTMDYQAALDLQERLLFLRQENRIPDTLLLLEHPPVLTLGKRGEAGNILKSPEELRALGVDVYEINRGGDVTYHGPGQLVGYPIVDLSLRGKDVRAFVEGLEDLFIRLLSERYGITAHREERKYTGVWVEDEKITAMGIAVKRWVTMHGFAFNVNTDLSHFQWINPCGITDRGVTSLAKLLGAPQDLARVRTEVADAFCSCFGFEPELLTLEELNGRMAEAESGGDAGPDSGTEARKGGAHAKAEA